METFTDLKQFRQIALSANKSRQDLTGLPHESVAEYLARGGSIKKILPATKESNSRLAVPTHAQSTYGYTIYDWRV